MILNIYEILEKFDAVETREERKDVLLSNQYEHLKEVLKYTFNPKYQFFVEDTFPVDYIQPDTFPGLRVAGIESEIRKAYLFLKGDQTAESLTEQKRHNLLLQLLESFEPKEAQIWFKMMQKDLQVEGLTESLVKEVFPELFL
jgi:hypothetical protein